MSAQLAVGNGLLVTTQGPFQRGAAAVWRAIDTPQRWLLLVLVAVLALVSAGVAVFIRTKAGTPVALLALTAFALAFLWVFWFSRLLLLQMAAREARMPRLEGDVLSGLLIAALATVVAPAMLMTLTGMSFLHALAVFTLAAAGMLLLAMLPRGLFAFAGFMPALVDHLKLPRFGWIHPDGALGLLAIAAVLLAAWRWKVLLERGGQDAPTSWMQPMVFGLQQQRGMFGAWSRLGDANFQRARIPAWLQQVGAVDALGPRTPVRAMRVIMGTPFMPLSARSRALQLALVLLWPVVGLLASDKSPLAFDATTLRHVSIAALAWVGAFGFVMLGFSVAPRLDALRRGPNRESAELALLPGWGTHAQARGLLLRSIAVPVAGMAVAVAVVIAASCAFVPVTTTGHALLGVTAIGALATAAMTCLRPLCGRTVSGAWIAGYMALVLPAAIVTFLGIAVSSRHALPIWSVWAWLAVDAGLIAYVAWLARQFIARPHPFLQD